LKQRFQKILGHTEFIAINAVRRCFQIKPNQQLHPCDCKRKKWLNFLFGSFHVSNDSAGYYYAWTKIALAKAITYVGLKQLKLLICLQHNAICNIEIGKADPFTCTQSCDNKFVFKTALYCLVLLNQQ